MSERKRCAIFDLDGTLADTIKDIANSVNLTRKEYGLEELPLEEPPEKKKRKNLMTRTKPVKKISRHHFQLQ